MKNQPHQMRFVVGAMILLFGAALAAIVHQGFLFAAPPADVAPEKAAAEPRAAMPASNPAKEADEQAIRATAEDFVKAFNAADVKAIGALWAPDAEYTDESDQSFQGRAAIEEVYADLFKQHLGAMMTVKIESLRLLGPDVALEKGVARVKSPGGIADTAARYTVVHAKRNGKWTMVFGRDAPYVPASNEDYLKDLEWLIGDWNPQAKELPLRRTSSGWRKGTSSRTPSRSPRMVKRP